MGTKSRVRACGALAAVNAAVPPVVADAQDSAIDRIEAIERQIGALQKELQQLKRELGEANSSFASRGARHNALRGNCVCLARPTNERARTRSRRSRRVTNNTNCTTGAAGGCCSPDRSCGIRGGEGQHA